VAAAPAVAAWVAVSGTGRGEALLGATTAVSVVRAMEFGGLNTVAAADRVLGGMAPGSAGLISVTPGGEVVMAKNGSRGRVSTPDRLQRTLLGTKAAPTLVFCRTLSKVAAGAREWGTC